MKTGSANWINISGTQILNIDLNQGWEITNLEFDNTCPPNWIDSLIVTFEKQKKEENIKCTTNRILGQPKQQTSDQQL